MSALPSILRHSSPDEPGISRRRRGRGFSYHLPDGALLKSERELSRIKALGLPPAYSDVWICRDGHGHLQAVGTDDRGRRQYRYHADWSAFRAQQKFDRLEAFGRALPRLRDRVEHDLRRNTPDRDQVCAALIRLIDQAALRIGSQQYADTNKTFGATTLRSRHLTLDGHTLRLAFRAKGGKRVRKQVSDRRLARVLERIDDLPGHPLFTYVAEDDAVRQLGSDEVNAYIADSMGEPDGPGRFTAKTFRTWHGSVAALDYAVEADEPLTIKAMSEAAAARLHNTPSIARSSYIHPAVIELAEMEPEPCAAALGALDLRRAPNALPTNEKRLIARIAV